ncbi:MAG: orotate phosphoribosyltransferase [Candidatus Diapherotrites archaeon CG11_big_fil_rev_8_21_14_0_20_37_9]|nr:MAG: orotate phosphoribosyltransferase [Candidatus Diapherotrites archaeon CG11_big_fil_rev_8_21_14_0_20_37_9]
MENHEKLALKLQEIGAVKFGLFTLKSGLKSPVYIDLRVLVSFPEVLSMVGKELAKKAEDEAIEFDLIAGIPFAAIAIATAVSLEKNWPMVFPRKEQKDYGTKAKVEGKYEKGQKVLVIDDLITTGSSKFEAVEPLEKEGLKIDDILVLVDREQGGQKELAKEGYTLHSVFKVTELLEILNEHGKIDSLLYESAVDYFENPGKWQEGK